MPARLVYAPKCWVYTKDGAGNLYNLSNYVTAGNVVRLVDQASTASVTLRNPQMKFTANATAGSAAFHPMDPITIYLERLSRHPVRVFTGYLDDTPYWQMYPGTITLNATCTLKRLLYTWFDPSLPYVIAFLEANGWTNTGQGSIISSQAYGSATVNTPGVTQSDVQNGVAQAFGNLQDGSIGKLLWATLYQMADWQDTQIYIEALPSGIPARMAALIADIETGEQTAASELSSFLSSIIGSGSQGSGGGAGGGAGGGDGVAMTGSASTALNANQLAFATRLAADTGLDANVVAAWVHSEEPASSTGAPNGTNNWLNIGDTGSGNYGGTSSVWSSPTTAADFTAQWLTGAPLAGYGSASSGIQAILTTVSQPPAAQILAIQQSGWASSHYPNLPSVYSGFANDPLIAPSTNLATSTPLAPLISTTAQTGATSSSTTGSTATSGTKETVFAAISQAASAISTANLPYVRGGGHSRIGVPSNPSSTATTKSPAAPAASVQTISAGTGGARAASDIKIIVLHVSQVPQTPGSTDDLDALYNGLTSQTLSVHVGTDGAGNSRRYVDDLIVAEHCAAYNAQSLGIEQTGYSNDVPSEIPAGQVSYWSSAQIQTAASWVAYWSALYNIPLVRSITNGVCEHGDLGVAGGNHPYCPGSSYPFDQVLSLAAAINPDSGVGFDCSGAVSAVLGAAGLLKAPEATEGIVSALGSTLLPGTSNAANAVNLFVLPSGPNAHTFLQINGLYWGTSDGNGGNASQSNDGAGYLPGSSSPDASNSAFQQYHIDPAKLLDKTTYSYTIAGGSGNTSAPNNPGSAATNVVGDANAQAFVDSLTFPSIEDQVIALALGTEHKGLMHDQSIMPFVQQLTQGSLRSFMSLPNGDFYAFYPDYFGEFGQHNPYWLIDDIEVTNGGIDLSDASLCTHYFTVGDNTWPVNTELLNDLVSSGAITIFNAFLSSDLIDTSALKASEQFAGGMADLMSQAEAIDFIKRYGARPIVNQYPMVRSSIMEMFLAYQGFMQAWSNQFLTPFEFTFMPELFPGGKVGFPKHGLQMYVQSVTHTWDLQEAGFTTTAQLAGPALMSGANSQQNHDLPPYMVQALVEPIRPDTNSAPNSDTGTRTTQTTNLLPSGQGHG
jgi:hypothetical protein